MTPLIPSMHDGLDSRGRPQRLTWAADEDERLRRLVAQHGPRQWGMISRLHGTRNDWQCRERWQNHLSPDVRKSDWSDAEDEMILRGYDVFGQVRMARAGTPTAPRADAPTPRTPRRPTRAPAAMVALPADAARADGARH